MPTFALSKFDTFGDVAAEDDAVLDYFLATNAVERIEKREAFLVLGRKGTGKTAIVRYFTEGNQKAVSKSLNLRGYPWSVHASRRDYGASDIEAYVSSWRYLIAVEAAAMAVAIPEIARLPETAPLRKFLVDNYGGPSPALSDILRPNSLRIEKFSLQPSVMGNQLGSVSLDRAGPNDHKLGLELNALSKSILDVIKSAAQKVGLQPLTLHFDELDQGLSEFDEARSKMLIGLILAAREINRSDKSVPSVNPVVYLRTDLWDDLQFSDKNKISQTLTLHLGWTSETLQNLVDVRLKAKLGSGANWNSLAATDLMRGSQTKWNHILARTFLRPRDVIRFLNTALKKAKNRDVEPVYFLNEDIVNSRQDYSSYLKSELDDEIRPHWSFWDEALQACSAISTVTFERGKFLQEYARRQSQKNTMTADQALAMLHRFSVIGYETRSGYGGSSWAFQYTDPESGWDNSANRFKVHLGLKEYAKLRESRENQQ